MSGSVSVPVEGCWVVIEGQVLPAKVLGWQCDHGDIDTTLVRSRSHAMACATKEFDWGVGGDVLVGVVLPIKEAEGG